LSFSAFTVVVICETVAAAHWLDGLWAVEDTLATSFLILHPAGGSKGAAQFQALRGSLWILRDMRQDKKNSLYSALLFKFDSNQLGALSGFKN